MAASPHDDRITLWVGDFLESAAFRTHTGPVREVAPDVLAAFLSRASAVRGVDPADIEEGDLKPGLLEGVGRLAVPEAARAAVPPLVADFLAEMERQGRLAGGATLGRYVRALAPRYAEAATGKPAPIRAAGSPLGRNDPCPCGSGRKYKKCCMRMLD